MKSVLISTALILTLCMIFLPLLASSGKQDITPPAQSENSTHMGELTGSPGYFLVKNPETGEISKVSDCDYVYGVVAGEMNMSYADEALKAQAVAAFTYACRKRQARINSNTGEYDLTSTYVNDQQYLTKDEAVKKWADKAAEYDARLKKLVSDVAGYVIVYENEPILAVCHAISGGKTETAANVWGKDYPYLRAVESAGDLMAPGYTSEKTFTPDQVKELLKEQSVTLSEDKSNWFGLPKCSESGMVLTIPVGGKSLTGRQLRELFALRSSNFTVKYEEDKFAFSVYGYGHGVGLSQYGAQVMALQGSTYVEILSWYYEGCSMKKI